MNRVALLATMFLVSACDKALHAGAGAGIAAVVYDVTGSREAGCVMATVAGVAKEMIDPIPDPFDIIATAAGGCAVVYNMGPQ